MTRLIAASFLLLGACSQPTGDQQAKGTQSPEEIGKLGSRSWAALECASIAMFAGDREKMAKLFEQGHRDGLKFIALTQAQKGTDQKKTLNKVPIIMGWRLEGPSPEFMLGRVWEATVEYTDDELGGRDSWSHQATDPKAKPVDEEVRKMTAENRFRQRNCELI